MILDTQSTFSDAQDLSQVAGTYPSTNILDAGAANADSGHGEGQGTFVNFRVNEDFVGVGAEVDVQIQTSEDEAFTSPVVLYSTGALPIATVNAGINAVRMPLGVLRYIRVAYVISGATTTAGQMSAFLSKDITRQRAYPIGHS